MANSPMTEILRHLRRSALPREGPELTDGQLLEAYISRRDETALAALVHRHGPMVWGVCRRVLPHYHDAEDAFQATFLVLVRKAGSIASPELLANWLHGVARQTAWKAQATAARRRARERQVMAMPEPEAVPKDPGNDLPALLDQELSRLPDRYRIVLLLCDLEGKTRKEAARRLGVPEGTVAGRLARARVLLAKRLGRHGLAISGGALATVLAEHAASAAVPVSVVSSTLKAATLAAAGQASAAGVISAQAAALSQGVLKAMLLKKLKVAAAALLTIFAGLGVALWAHTAFAAGDDPFAQAGSTPRSPDDKPAKNAESDKERDKLNDAEFIRRACLDIRGTLPTPIEMHYFLQDKNPDKRKWLVGKLSEEKVTEKQRRASEEIQKILMEIEELRRVQEERHKQNRPKETDKE